MADQGLELQSADSAGMSIISFDELLVKFEGNDEVTSGRKGQSLLFIWEVFLADEGLQSILLGSLSRVLATWLQLDLPCIP